jgi:hypothetical protein
MESRKVKVERPPQDPYFGAEITDGIHEFSTGSNSLLSKRLHLERTASDDFPNQILQLVQSSRNVSNPQYFELRRKASFVACYSCPVLLKSKSSSLSEVALA